MEKSFEKKLLKLIRILHQINIDNVKISSNDFKDDLFQYIGIKYNIPDKNYDYKQIFLYGITFIFY